MADVYAFLVVVVVFCAYVGGVSATSHPASLAIIVMSVIIPGLVLLTCIIGTIFLCWNRDRIPLFRSKAKAYSKPDSKVQTPLSPGQGYPTQSHQPRPQTSPDKTEEVKMKMEPLDEKDLVVAVHVNEFDTPV